MELTRILRLQPDLDKTPRQAKGKRTIQINTIGVSNSQVDQIDSRIPLIILPTEIEIGRASKNQYVEDPWPKDEIKIIPDGPIYNFFTRGSVKNIKKGNIYDIMKILVDGGVCLNLIKQ